MCDISGVANDAIPTMRQKSMMLTVEISSMLRLIYFKLVPLLYTVFGVQLRAFVSSQSVVAKWLPNNWLPNNWHPSTGLPASRWWTVLQLVQVFPYFEIINH